MRYHILLAHGGDERHSPWKKEEMAAAGFDYIACGHIHKPEILIPGRMAYAGALEPTTLNQTGEHGYIDGVLDARGIRISFVPFAVCEYVQLTIPVDEDTTQYSLEQELAAEMERRGGGEYLPGYAGGNPQRESGVLSEAGCREPATWWRSWIRHARPTGWIS